jgi:hypothetical protein
MQPLLSQMADNRRTLRGRHSRHSEEWRSRRLVQLPGRSWQGLSERSSATPVMPKSAAPQTIISALKFVLSPQPCVCRVGNVVTRPGLRGSLPYQRAKREPKAMCGSVAKLARCGAETSVAERVMATSGLRRSTIFPGRVKRLCPTIRSHTPFRGRWLSEGRDWLSVTAGFFEAALRKNA